MASKRESQLSKIPLAFDKALTRIISSEYPLQKYCLRNGTASRAAESISCHTKRYDTCDHSQNTQTHKNA